MSVWIFGPYELQILLIMLIVGAALLSAWRWGLRRRAPSSLAVAGIGAVVGEMAGEYDRLIRLVRLPYGDGLHLLPGVLAGLVAIAVAKNGERIARGLQGAVVWEVAYVAARAIYFSFLHVPHG